MKKKKRELAIQSEIQVDESQIFERVASIIETRKTRAGMYANRELTLMYWEVGHYINSLVLNDGRAEYGKKILPSLAAKLMAKYGNARTRQIRHSSRGILDSHAAENRI